MAQERFIYDYKQMKYPTHRTCMGSADEALLRHDIEQKQHSYECLTQHMAWLEPTSPHVTQHQHK